jgi:5'-nucleotidase
VSEQINNSGESSYIDWNQIDEVFLDMDGTLLDLHYDNYFWLEYLPGRYAEMRGLDENQVRQYLHDRYQVMQGTLDWYCLEYWERELEIEIVELKREVLDRVRYRPQAEEFLKWLSQSGKRVVLVTNAHRWSIELKFSHLDMRKYFDRICSSHDFLAPKETQEFWQALEGELAFDKARTLFIDDNHDVLHSARNFGIQHLLAIETPDMTRPPKVSLDYRAITDFRDLMNG